jgi:hypothetical protein
MIKTLSLVLFSLLAFAFRTAEDYKNYCNEQYNFCIKYPKTFKFKSKADNGDGAIFISSDKKAEIRAYGSRVIEGLDDLDQEFNSSTEAIKVTYQLKKQNWFVFSGIDKKGILIYQKTIVTNVSDYYDGDKEMPVFQTIRFTYPQNQKDQYNAYCAVIAKSL